MTNSRSAPDGLRSRGSHKEGVDAGSDVRSLSYGCTVFNYKHA